MENAYIGDSIDDGDDDGSLETLVVGNMDCFVVVDAMSPTPRIQTPDSHPSAHEFAAVQAAARGTVERRCVHVTAPSSMRSCSVSSLPLLAGASEMGEPDEDVDEEVDMDEIWAEVGMEKGVAPYK